MHPILEEIENYKKKAVLNARAILSNQVAIPFGAVRMNRIIIWSQKTNALKDVTWMSSQNIQNN
jgi:hypothetical protein